jgi:hypothetical protein
VSKSATGEGPPGGGNQRPYAARRRQPIVDRQLIGGLSGGIIIEGSDRLYPFLKALPEKVLLLTHQPVGRTDYEELVTVNGVVAPNIPIRPGEAQFWQIGNIGADRFLRVKIEGTPFYLLGRDAYFVPRPFKMDSLILGPGQRVSVVVVGGAAGRHAFKSVEFKFDEAQPPLPEWIWARSCRKVRQPMLLRLQHVSVRYTWTPSGRAQLRTNESLLSREHQILDLPSLPIPKKTMVLRPGAQRGFTA